MDKALKQLSISEKKGICLYFNALCCIHSLVKLLFGDTLYEKETILLKNKGVWRKNTRIKLSDYQKNEILKEIAMYVYSVSTIEVWNYKITKDYDIPIDEKQIILDVLTGSFFRWFGLHDIKEELKKYQDEERLEEFFSKKLLMDIIKERNAFIHFDIVTTITGVKLGLIERTPEVLQFSEDMMDKMIKDFMSSWVPLIDEHGPIKAIDIILNMTEKEKNKRTN